MAQAAAISVPSMVGITRGIQSYGIGVLAGIGSNLVTGFTGSGLIGTALTAAVVSSMVRGVVGEMIAVNAGFALGQQGIPALGLGALGGMNWANPNAAAGVRPSNGGFNFI